MFTQSEAINIVTSIVRSEHPNVEVGAGLDDVAVFKFGNSRLAITSDYLNFGLYGRDLDVISLFDCGYLLIVLNVSDLIASGATPMAAVVALGLPTSLNGENLRDIAQGIRLAADECGVSIVGGDTKEAPQLTLNATLFGELGAAGLWARSGARDGDLLFVSGPIGGVSAAVLALHNGKLGSAIDQLSAGVLARPTLPLVLAEQLRSSGTYVSAIDISDGLGMNSHQLADVSNMGLEIQALDIPLHPLALQVADKLKLDAWRLAFGIGGDGQFLFAVAPQDEALAVAAGGIRIGRVVDSKARILVQPFGREILPSFGHEDFTGESSINGLLNWFEQPM